MTVPDPMLTSAEPANVDQTGSSWSNNPQAIPTRTGGVVTMPEWVSEYRDNQVSAVDAVLDAYESGYRIVILSAPTGSGKTLIAETARRIAGWSGLYVCSTKTLQDQVMEDFTYAKLLKGRSNYPTLDKPEAFRASALRNRLTAADCDKHQVYPNNEDGTVSAAADYECSWCSLVRHCPYEVAKHEALQARLAVLNTSYLLTEANFLDKSAFSGQKFVIADEADLLESELLSILSVSIPHSAQRKMRLGTPRYKTKPEAWAEWLRASAPKIAKHIRNLPIKTDDLAIHRERRSLSRLQDRILNLASEVERGDWVYMGDEGRSHVFKPVRVSNYGGQWLWRHAHHWLLMSATVIAPEEMMKSLGGQDLPWTVVNVPSAFPPEQRPIRIMPIVEMTHRTKDTSYPVMADAVRKVLERHPDERILVHAVSYELSNYLMRNVKSTRTLTYASADERENALKEYLDTPGAVLIAPSMERGVDMPDEACRVIVVCKLPHPNLGDKQVNARLHSEGGQLWYECETIRALVQMTGRGVRHEEDWAVTYILDRGFVSRVWKKSRDYLPQWWKESIDWGAGTLA